MPRLTAPLAPLALLLTLGFASTADAKDFAFKPFTVHTVCETCAPPAGDEVTLSDGTVLHVKVIAVNSAFYTLSSNGEIRTAPKGDVKSVKWKNGSQPAGIDTLDQIVLKNGHVLTGTISNEDKTLRQIRGKEHAYVVNNTEAAAVFKKGRAI